MSVAVTAVAEAEAEALGSVDVVVFVMELPDSSTGLTVVVASSLMAVANSWRWGGWCGMDSCDDVDRWGWTFHLKHYCEHGGGPAGSVGADHNLPTNPTPSRFDAGHRNFKLT